MEGQEKVCIKASWPNLLAVKLWSVDCAKASHDAATSMCVVHSGLILSCCHPESVCMWTSM